MDENQYQQDGDQNNHHQHDHNPSSEPFGNASETSQNDSEHFGNVSEDGQNHSEGFGNHDGNVSEDQRNSPQNGAETFGNDSERTENGSDGVPNRSEEEQKRSETIRNHSERTLDHTMTVRDVAKAFEDAGVSRTERSIVNWCNVNRQGVRRLDCYYDDLNRKYFITPLSVDKVIIEEKHKAQTSDYEPKDYRGIFGKQPEVEELPKEESEPQQSEVKEEQPTQPIEDKESVPEAHELKQKNSDLEMLNKVKDYQVSMLEDQMEKQREGFLQERKDIIEQLMNAKQQIGTLETKLLQLEAPRQEPIDVEAVTTPEYVQKEQLFNYDKRESKNHGIGASEHTHQEHAN